MNVIITRCLLQDILDKKGVTQQQLADITGIPASNISDYVHRRRFMSLTTAIKITHRLNVRLDDLYEYHVD